MNVKHLIQTIKKLEGEPISRENSALLQFYCRNLMDIRGRLIDKIASDFTVDYRLGVETIDNELELDDKKFQQMVYNHAKQYKPMSIREKELALSHIQKELEQWKLA